MATLNSEETKALQEIRTILEEIQRNGYDPKIAREEWHGKPVPDSAARARRLARDIETSRRRLHTITMMKGHYPK